MPEYHPSTEQLSQLKAPLGELIPGGPAQTIPKLRQLIDHVKPPKTITVGDVVSTEARAAGIKVDLGIIDGKTMRREYDGKQPHHSISAYHVSNPAGTITEDAWMAVRNALKKSNATVFVDGEEDLLTVPAVIEAPEGAIVVYGQPSEGIVVVRVTSGKKAELNSLIRTWTTV